MTFVGTLFSVSTFDNHYNEEWVKGWLALDGQIMDEMNISEGVRRKYYNENYMRFLKCQDIDHRLPQINK